MCTEAPKHKGLGIALFVIYIGVVFMLSNLKVISQELKEVLISWQMLLVGIGVVMFIRKKWFPGIIMLVLGLITIQSKVCKIYTDNPLCIIDTDLHAIFHTYWPVLLIILGVFIIVGASKKKENQFYSFGKKRKYRHECGNSVESSADYFNRDLMFSGAKQIVFSQQFKGGEANVAFAGLEIDLRKAKMDPSGAVIEMNAFCGGITLYVPNTWRIDMRSDALFGGFEDHRNILEDTDPNSPILTLKISCLFGGGEIKN